MRILKDNRIINGSSIFIMDNFYANYSKTIYGPDNSILKTDNSIDLDFVRNNSIERVILYTKINSFDVLTMKNSLLNGKDKCSDIEVLKLIAKNSKYISLIFKDGLCYQIEYIYDLTLNNGHNLENYLLLIDEDHPSLDWLLID